MYGPDFVYFDTETTGNHSQQPDEIIQIAIVDHLGNTLLNSLVKPTGEISPESTAVHGLTWDDVKDAPTFADILPDIHAALEGKTAVAYNAVFDHMALIISAHFRGVILEPVSVACAMRAYHNLWAGEFQAPWQKLTAALEQQGLPILENAHDALADAEMCRRLCEAMQIGKLKATAHDEWHVTFTALTLRLDRNGREYLSLTTKGGQRVNVFMNSRQLDYMESRGYPILGWMSRLIVDVEQPLSPQNHIGAVVELDGGYINIQQLTTEYSGIKAAAS